MNILPLHLLCLSLLVALTWVAGIRPAARASAAPQLISCQPISGQGSIAGAVRDSSGGPLSNVRVSAHPTAGGESGSAVTDAAGAYEIGQLPAGSYLLEFIPQDSASQAVWYNGSLSSPGATPVAVSADATTGGVDIQLPPGSFFAITVRDPAGDPVPNAGVAVFDRYGRQVAAGKTDSQGATKTRPGLPAGEYRLQAVPDSESPLLGEYYSHQPTLDAAEPLTLSQAPGGRDVQLTLLRGAQLGGTVTDEATGAPLADVYVYANLERGGVSAQTDAAGRYTLAGLPSGTHEIQFHSLNFERSGLAPLSRLATVSAPSLRDGFDVALALGGTIRGRVTRADGAPIPDVQVRASNVGDLHGFGTTAADGAYTITNLISGSYALSFSSPGYVEEYYDDSHDPTQLQRVSVTAPNTTADVNAVLRLGGAISGKVTDPDGKPLAGVRVSVLDVAIGEARSEAETDAAGFYETRQTLPPGEYVVRFDPPRSAAPCPLAIEYYGGAATAAGATHIRISGEDNVTRIDAALEYGGVISGEVSDAASGLPLPYASVSVYDANGEFVTSASASKLGRYSTRAGLPAGAYRVQFWADGYAPAYYGGAPTFEEAASVPGGSANISAALARGGTLRGHVTAADTGAPLGNATVTLYDAAGRAVRSESTTVDGSYFFWRSLPSGAYRVGVTPGETVDGTPYFTGYYAVFSGGARSLESAQTVAVVAPQTVTVDLAMPTTQSPQPTPTTPPTPAPGAQRVYLPLVQR